jgi:hypothetical protein
VLNNFLASPVAKTTNGPFRMSILCKRPFTANGAPYLRQEVLADTR